MVHSVLCNRRSSFGAAWGVRTTGTNVSGCASGATVSGARSKTSVVQVPRRSSTAAGAENVRAI